MMNTASFFCVVANCCANSFFCKRQASRSSRLIRLRCTAFLKWRVLTEKAHCNSGASGSVGWRYKTRNGYRPKDLPEANNCSMRLRLFSFSLRPNVYRCLVFNIAKKSLQNYFWRRKYDICPLGYSFVYFLSTLSLETVNFLRPFLRRADNTLRPLALAMRSRKPCTDLRRRLWGWYVRFLFAIALNFSFYKILLLLIIQTRQNHHILPLVKGRRR